MKSLHDGGVKNWTPPGISGKKIIFFRYIFSRGPCARTGIEGFFVFQYLLQSILSFYPQKAICFLACAYFLCYHCNKRRTYRSQNQKEGDLHGTRGWNNSFLVCPNYDHIINNNSFRLYTLRDRCSLLSFYKSGSSVDFYKKRRHRMKRSSWKYFQLLFIIF